MGKKNIFIIAEAGVNHNGSLKVAKKLMVMQIMYFLNLLKETI